jgi:hypothetical protein
MKKKVRIYRAPDGQGKVINKLSSFIQKAQEGGMPDPNTMGYPQETAAPSEDQISQMIISDISNGRPKEETVVKIANSSGLDPMSVNQYYDQLYAALEQEQEQEIAANEEEDEEDVVQPEVEEQVIEEDFYGDDYNNDTSNEIVAEDEEEDYSDEDAFASDLVMKFGGSYKKAKNAFVKQQVSLVKKQTGGVEPVKNSDSDPIGEDFRKNKLQAFIGTVKNESAQAKAKEQAEQQFDQMMQQQQMQQYPMEQPMAQFGMSMKSRRGMQRDPGFAINPDTGKPWSSSEWNNQVEVGQGVGKNGRPKRDLIIPRKSEPGYVEPNPNANPYIQGNSVPNIYGNQMMAPRRGLFGRPKMPKGFGFGYGMPPVTKMDVRRTGLFGRPKEYSMEFGNPGFGAGYAMPGMGAGFYGYGQTTKQQGKTKGRIITEEIAKTVNEASTKEVATNTPGNTATDKPNDGAASTTTPGSTASNIQQNTGADGKRKATQVNDEATDAVVNNSETTREQKKQKDLYLQGLPGSSYEYARENGKWKYWDPNKEQYFNVGNEGNLNRLEAGENKSATYYTLPGKKGYYYRHANDGSYIKFKGDPSKHTAQTQPVGKITKKDKAWNYVDANTVAPEDKETGYNDLLEFPNAPKPVSPAGPTLSNYVDKVNLLNSFGPKYETGGQAYYNPFGGFVDSENPNLYKFIYGGDDIDQADIDDMYAKDTTDPYFRYGGLTTYQTKGEVKEDDYDKYQREKAEKEAADEYNAYMNRGEGDKSKMVAYKANPNDAIYNKILGQTRKKYNLADPNEQPKVESKKTTATTSNNTTTQQSNPYANIGYNGFNAFGSLFPANIATNRGSWAQMRRGPYDRLSGANIPGMGFGPNTQVQSIDVTKSGMFGRPKKYTINYGNQEMDPRKQNLITLPGQGATPAAQSTGAGRTFSNTEGLGAGATGAIRRGERRTARELARGEKQNLSASDANLDPYAGFPLDHPIRTEEKLETNSVKDYLKPSQKSPSSLGLSPFVAAPAQQKLDDSNVPSAFKDPIGNTIQNEKAAKDKQDIMNKSLDEYGDVFNEMNLDPNVYKDVYQRQGKEAADQMMTENFSQRNDRVQKMEEFKAANANNPEYAGLYEESSNNIPNDLPETQNFDNILQQKSMLDNTEDFTKNENYDFYSNPANQSMVPEQYQPEADVIPGEEVLTGRDGKGGMYSKWGEWADQIKTNRNNRQNNRPTQKNQPVKRVSPEEFQRRLDKAAAEGKKYEEGVIYNDSNLSDRERQINSQMGINAYYQKSIDALHAEYGKAIQNKDYAKMDEIDAQMDKINEEKRKELGIEIPDYIQYPNDYLYRRMLKNREYEQRKNKFIEDKRLLKPKWMKQFGGDLSRFTDGGNSPVTYTNNPAFVGMSNVDMLTLNEGIPGLQPSNFWNEQQSFNEKVPVNTQKQPEEIKMDKNQLSSDQAKKEYQATPGKFSMDFKTKNMWEVDPEGSLATLNAGVRGAAGLIDRFRNKGREQRMYEGMNAENLYAVDPSRDRGDYDTNTGLYRAADMGQTWNSRSKQYGGAMDDYYEGDEIDMTEEELADFLANGGEVEYL